MRKILFPLYLKEDEADFRFYQNIFEKEGFVFAKAKTEQLLLRADAVLCMADEKINEDEEISSFLNTALSRDIPVVLIHASENPELQSHAGVIDANTVSFETLRKMIAERQSDIFRKEQKETKGSKIFGIICFVICALLAAVLLWRAVSFTMNHEEEKIIEKEEISEHVRKSVVRVYSLSSMNEDAWRGCGFVIDENGYIVTNAHVVDHAAVSYYVMYRENRYEAEVIAVSEQEDIALLKINTSTNAVLKISEVNPLKDDVLYAVGYPGDQKLTVLSGTSLGGVIHFEKGVSYMPVQMALKEGISGSPVLNQYGEVAGIASAVSVQDENLSFIVPADLVRDFVKDYLFMHE